MNEAKEFFLLFGFFLIFSFGFQIYLRLKRGPGSPDMAV